MAPLGRHRARRGARHGAHRRPRRRYGAAAGRRGGAGHRRWRGRMASGARAGRSARRRGGTVTTLRRNATVAWAIARKDALAEVRGKQAAVSTLTFAALVLLLFGFALGSDPRRLADAAPGLLWLGLVFAGLLAVGRFHEVETEDGALEQLTLYPVDRRSIYAGKAAI
ncbi:MAG: hypothetical protein E6I62_02395, partial [Chloroflexi bacterium]